MIELCFVCLGNICRSPTAEGVMLHLLDEKGISDKFVVDSAGTAAYHIGNRADARSALAASRRGVELPSRARQFKAVDYGRFDYVLAMDETNFENLRALDPINAEGKLFLLRDFDPGSPKGSSVPDPYYGGAAGFEEVLDLCFAGCQGLLDHILSRHQLQDR